MNVQGGIRILIIAVLAGFLPPIQAKAPDVFAFADNQSLETKINHILISEPILKGGIAGISIRSAKTGEIQYEHNGNVRLRPASNLKLMTAASALLVLGEDYSFITKILTNGAIQGNTLNGNLYLQGKGDPTLRKEDLDQMAIRLAKSGIEEINGDLIGDDSWYDDVRLSPDLVWSDENVYYGAQISALTISPNSDFDSGTIQIEVFPGKTIGEHPYIKLTPNSGYVNIVNRAVTISPDGETDIKIGRVHGTNTILVEGMFPLGADKEKEWVAVWEPTGYALNLFKQSLDKQGIKLSGTTKIGQAPNETHVLTSHKSIALSELLHPFMKLSNNGHAEVLVKEMGKIKKGEGSWEKGLEVMNEVLPALGVHPESLVIRDGSGISHVNLLPANEISNLLYTVQKEPWFDSFLNSLPVAGKNERMVGGTLRNRMESLNVKAKTGTISTVTSLSGYVETKGGDTLIFSILLNNILDEEKGKEVEDKIVDVLANLKNE